MIENRLVPAVDHFIRRGRARLTAIRMAETLPSACLEKLADAPQEEHAKIIRDGLADGKATLGIDETDDK